jgi:hypothetical protein
LKAGIDQPFSLSASHYQYIYLMTIKFIFDTIEMVLRKERKGSLKKSQIQTAVRVGINNFFDKQLRIFRMTGVIPTPLRPLTKTSALSIASSQGNLPTDFAKEVTFYVANVNSNPAEFLSRPEFEERKNSVLMPPTEVDPIGTVEGTKILVRPQNLVSINFVYIKKPTEIVFGTTVSGDNRDLIFSSGASTDTDFSIEYAPEIIKEALQFLGVPQQDEAAQILGEKTNG